MLTAYYFRAHLYTIVPHHVREDMKWMADLGTQQVALGVLEQDLFAAIENIAIIAEEAARAGMSLAAVPSRWGSIVAGSPKVPSIFSARRPDACVHNKDGQPNFNNWLGPIASVHHPDTEAFFRESLSKLFALAPFTNVIWDEPKNLNLHDYNPRALAKAPPDAPTAWHNQQVAAFFGRINQYIHSHWPTVRTSLFTYATAREDVIECLASIAELDDFGCDGRPWGTGHTESNSREEDRKLLLVRMPAFIEAARAAGKHPLALIENHNLSVENIDTIDQHLPEVLQLPIDHLMYYYFPRSVAEPQRAMDTLARHLRTWPRTR